MSNSGAVLLQRMEHVAGMTFRGRGSLTTKSTSRLPHTEQTRRVLHFGKGKVGAIPLDELAQCRAQLGADMPWTTRPPLPRLRSALVTPAVLTLHTVQVPNGLSVPSCRHLLGLVPGKDSAERCRRRAAMMAAPLRAG